MDSDQARQQLDTLDHLRRRVQRRVDRPALLLFALGFFLSLALKQFGERTETLSIVVLPLLIAVWHARQNNVASRRTSLGRLALTIAAITAWQITFITFGEWNPFGWAYVWPVAGLLAALPLVLFAWSRRA